MKNLLNLLFIITVLISALSKTGYSDNIYGKEFIIPLIKGCQLIQINDDEP